MSETLSQIGLSGFIQFLKQKFKPEVLPIELCPPQVPADLRELQRLISRRGPRVAGDPAERPPLRGLRGQQALQRLHAGTTHV